MRAHRAIVRAFEQQVVAIFGDNLRFAFVCGSVARGQARLDHDIDTVVVLAAADERQQQAFFGWLAQLHQQMGMQVDDAYPAEVLTQRQLDAALAGLGTTRLSLDFNPSATFDQVTWAEMIAATRVGEVGDVAALRALAAAVAPQVERLRQALLQDVAAQGQLAHQVQAYFAAQVPPGPPPGLEQLSLPRLMTRLVPLPTVPPPAGTSALAEALRVAPPLLTAHLQLRPLQPQDAATLASWRQPDTLPPLGADALGDVQEWLSAEAQADDQQRSWAVCSRQGGAPVGLARLRLQPDGRAARAEAWMAPGVDDHQGSWAQQARDRLQQLADRLAAAPL